MVEVRKSFCRNCGAACGVALEVEGSSIRSLRGDADNPVSRGYFCVKGQASVDLQNGRGRLHTSLRRTPTGHEPIALTMALDDVADRLGTLMGSHGPNSIALYYGTGAYNSALTIPVAKGFARSLGTHQLYSSQTIDQSPKNITALRMGSFASGRQPFATSDVWLLSGSNPLASHLGGLGGYTMYSPNRAIREAKKRGMTFIVIDPRLTETAGLADLHLRPRPGQDVVVTAAILEEILTRGLHDRSFCDRWVTNLDVLRAALVGFTPERAEMESGVPAEDIRRAAELFGLAPTGSATSGTGANMSPFANLAEHLLECLNVVCGRYRRVGDQVLNPSMLSAAAVREGVNPANPIWDHSPRMASHPEVGWAIPGEFPTNLLADEIRHSGPDRVRALLVVAGNPLFGIPDYDAVREAFGELELLVTLDVRMSETSELADYVLACATPYERADLAGMTDTSSPFPALQYTEPVVTPPGDVAEEWQIFHGLSRRLGFELKWEYWRYGTTADSEVSVLGVDDCATTDDLLGAICEHPQVSFAQIKSQSGQVGMIPSVDPTWVQEARPENQARLDVAPAEILAELRESTATSQGQQLAPGELLLHNRRLLEAKNSVFLDSAATRRRAPVNPIYMHPEDLLARGLEDGAIVEVRSARSRLTTVARKDASQLPGTVSIHHSWATGPDRRPVTALIDRTILLEAHNYVPRMSAIPVTVSAVADSTLP